MIPKKLFWMLGYNNLSIILEQERRHWLMKTDSNKQVQNTLTGDIFQGQVENIGSDVILESKKLPYNYGFVPEMSFKMPGANEILSINNSAFPHSAMVNGLMFARITSTNFPSNVDGTLEYNHYRLRFNNAETCIIPFGASLSSNEVYADKWIRSTTPPTLLLLNPSTGRYTVTKELEFSENVTNAVFYYPLAETLQPLELTDLGDGGYELQAVNDDGFIGYPLFWFTCDQTNIGSNLTFENNTNARNEQIFFISNAGDTSPFNAKIYTGVDGNLDATPDGQSCVNYTIRCSCKTEETFINNSPDFNKRIDPASVKLVNNVDQVEYSIPFICNDMDEIKMSSDVPWTYVDDHTYEIEMSYFDQNCINVTTTSTPLVSIFDVHFDESIPFVKKSTDVGIAGVRMSASNPTSDVYERYPYNLNKWEGLPEWMNNLEDGMVPEHLIMYAFHQPPTYDADHPETMQGAGLILDPGKHNTSTDEFDDLGNPINNADNIGRVYVLSNDDIEYKNNANETYPKPARTAARICDIPTSVMQLTGVTGLSPEPIVDKKYVRSEASYTNADKDRLYNELTSRWVRPTALSKNNKQVWAELGFPNKFAFSGLETLEYVDMYDHNDFRRWDNLNPMVDVSKISVERITNGGSGYKVNDMGVCVVGGYSFTYIVEEVTTGGIVTKICLSPDDRATHINLSNFNISEEYNGSSDEYGTSPTSGIGKGLKFTFRIDYDYYHSILPKRGEFYPDLFALVRERDGLYVYNYKIKENSEEVPKPGKWEQGMKISEYEITSFDKKSGGVATQESYINSIIPSVRDLPVAVKKNNSDPTSLVVLQTASFVNIIDKQYTPVVPDMGSDTIPGDNVVDLCKFCCDGISELMAETKTVDGVRKRLEEANVLRFDSYVIWRWKSPTNDRDKTFEYGIVYRSFNNLFTTDEITMLPTNKLACDNYVHTNANTTVVWNDVPGIGVMMWVYDPSYNKKENYYIDPETMDLHITRDDMTYENIDIRQASNGTVVKIVEDGVYKFNVMTNNPMSVEDPGVMSPIYQQPEMTQLNDVQVGKTVEGTTKEHMPCGNWRLVFPRVNSFTLKNDETNTQWIPKKMQVIKGRFVGGVGSVYDSEGHDVSMKSIIMDETADGVNLKIFNSTTKTWDNI